jgi:hypothetical protein
MYSITDDEIDFILSDLEQQGIETEDVKYNILDHVCCIIENDLPKGGNFKEFYRNTIARFYRKELSEIEEETRKLITFKYYYAMKRTMKITGFVTAFLILAGAIFKTMHWPGAGVAIVLGLGLFSLVFIPLNVVMKFRDDDKSQNRAIMGLGMFTIAVACIGVLFKVMHWPGANIMIISSLGIFGLLFIPIYFYMKFRDPESRFNGMITTVFMLAGAGMLFAMINIRPSKYVMDSVDSMFDYQDQSIDRFQDNNAALYSEVEGNGDIEHLQSITSDLLVQIEAIKTKLIAESNGISEAKAADLEASDLTNPHDVGVVRQHFELAKGNLSYEGFMEAVATYNSGLQEIEADNVIRPIKIEGLLMTRTMVSVVLQNLAEIEIQVLANENSFLSLKKGLMATK